MKKKLNLSEINMDFKKFRKKLFMLVLSSSLLLTGCAGASDGEVDTAKEQEMDIDIDQLVEEKVNERLNDILEEIEQDQEVKDETSSKEEDTENTTDLDDLYDYIEADLSNFKGDSIKALLKSINLPYDSDFRTQLAVLYSVVDNEKAYKKTAEQNTLLVNEILEQGIILVINKNDKTIVGCKNPYKEKIIFINPKAINKNNKQTTSSTLDSNITTTNPPVGNKPAPNGNHNDNSSVENDSHKKDEGDTNQHEHIFSVYVSSTYKSGDQHIATYKCPKDGATTTKTEKCSKKTKKENGYTIIYCTKCKYEFSRVQDEHVDNFVGTGSYQYNGNGTHSEILECSCGKTILSPSNEICTKDEGTLSEDGTKKIYKCIVCEGVLGEDLVHTHSADHTEQEGCTIYNVCSCGEKLGIVETKHTSAGIVKSAYNQQEYVDSGDNDICYTYTEICSVCGELISSGEEKHNFGNAVILEGDRRYEKEETCTKGCGSKKYTSRSSARNTSLKADYRELLKNYSELLNCIKKEGYVNSEFIPADGITLLLKPKE